MYVRKKSGNLDPSAIVAAAIDLLNEVGLDALTTRRLADRLGITSPALYWHISSRDQLLGLMCESIMETTLVTLDAKVDWPVWLVNIGLADRKSLLNLKDGGRLFALAPWTERSKTELMERYIEPMLRAQITYATAVELISIISSYCMGWVIYEQRNERHQFMVAHYDVDIVFEQGLHDLVRGMEVRLGHPA